ncbi:hypothetical protein [Idiomarina abyssalis]|uniref:hypothetical protein n=1 Tax=Idiomarina abyssalis TaxID=86102 RepID=UPI003A90AFF8
MFFEMLYKIPTSAWIAFSTALLTSLITLLGVSLTNKSSNERLKIQLAHEMAIRKDEMYRARLEELYVESKKYIKAIITHFIPYRSVMAGDITYNDALDISLNKNYNHNADRICLIIDMYFPELQERYLSIKKQLDVTSDILHSYKAQYKSGITSGDNWIDDFQESLDLLSTKAKKFEDQISKIAKSL